MIYHMWAVEILSPKGPPFRITLPASSVADAYSAAKRQYHDAWSVSVLGQVT